jgi:hypothetical protein
MDSACPVFIATTRVFKTGCGLPSEASWYVHRHSDFSNAAARYPNAQGIISCKAVKQAVNCRKCDALRQIDHNI